MAEERTLGRTLPVGKTGHRTPGFWGVLALIATEGAVFAYLFFSYFYLLSQSTTPWPPSGPPPMQYAIPTTIALLVSAAALWWAQRSIRLARRGQMMLALAIAALLGIVYLILQLLDWNAEPFLLQEGAYASLFYTITGFHLLHAAVGVLILATMILWSGLGHITGERYIAIDVAALYWYFVVVVWIAVFITFYVLPWITPA
ncbi:MAG TPA: cytochrome c oxidase subunit 3 [Rhodanobacteraceae bacterium]|nr:cytochrome c oxidase subunit 3 [Rhodanobacteraceae bacterium]